MTDSQININPKICKLILSKGKITIIDSIDYELLSKYKWHICHDYAVTNRKAIDANGHLKRRLIYLHKFIINPPKGMEVDHINGNKLDNRRCNLRIATRSQNQINTKKISGCTSKYRGVSWHKSAKKWRAQIQINGKKIPIGIFIDEIDAALAYNKKAIEYFGEFPRLNIIEE